MAADVSEQSTTKGSILFENSHGVGLKRVFYVSWLLAWNDIAARYRRTAIGPIWMILTHMTWIVAMFLVSSGLFGATASEYLPYLAVSITFWNLLAYPITGAPMIYLRASGYISSFPFPLHTYPLQFEFSTLIIFLHQALVPLAVMIIFNKLGLINLLYFFPVLLIFAINGLSISLLIGALGARYRDLQHLLESITTMLFLLTPIFWQKDILVRNEWIVHYNPFAHLLDLARGAVLGEPLTTEKWMICLGITIVLAVPALLVHRWSRSRIYFWIQ